MLKEQLKKDKVKLEDTFEKVEREKEELRTYVVKLELQLKEMDGHGQENALEEEEGQGGHHPPAPAPDQLKTSLPLLEAEQQELSVAPCP